jgi:cell division protein FtsI/penicillin-binding protein 2
MTRRSFLASVPLMAPATRVRWLVTDLQGAMEFSNWSSDRAVSMGSLLKPFLALAFLETHAAAPVIRCPGCWLPRGHGAQDLVAAIANSCNYYFLHLGSQIEPAALERVCLEFGLSAPDRQWSVSRLIGLGAGWPQVPIATAKAFGRLVGHRSRNGMELVLAGMRRCSSSGTAKELGVSSYAKTGTGACSHFPSASADGYVGAIWPAEAPRCVLLAQLHNGTGARTAREAGKLKWM